jgi:hypothetical protein
MDCRKKYDKKDMKLFLNEDTEDMLAFIPADRL